MGHKVAGLENTLFRRPVQQHERRHFAPALYAALRQQHFRKPRKQPRLLPVWLSSPARPITGQALAAPDSTPEPLSFFFPATSVCRIPLTSGTSFINPAAVTTPCFFAYAFSLVPACNWRMVFFLRRLNVGRRSLENTARRAVLLRRCWFSACSSSKERDLQGPILFSNPLNLSPAKSLCHRSVFEAKSEKCVFRVLRQMLKFARFPPRKALNSSPLLAL